MAVLTFETCWTVNGEIIYRVTSSWSIFIQVWITFCRSGWEKLETWSWGQGEQHHHSHEGAHEEKGAGETGNLRADQVGEISHWTVGQTGVEAARIASWALCYSSVCTGRHQYVPSPAASTFIYLFIYIFIILFVYLSIYLTNNKFRPFYSKQESQGLNFKPDNIWACLSRFQELSTCRGVHMQWGWFGRIPHCVWFIRMGGCRVWLWKL